MKQLEDLIGKILLVIAFSFLLAMEGLTITAMLRNPSSIDYWALALVSRLVSLGFLSLVLYLTVTRLPAKSSAAGIEPRLTAIGGTFLLLVLVVLPPASVGQGARLVATVLIVVGTALSIYCLRWLGRSLSMMATARRLVTGGPYGVVRHPLYLTEAVTVVGIVISNWSVAAVLVGIAQFALQFRRMHHEERVLREAFPEYAEYAAAVPKFIPRLRPSHPALRAERPR